MHNTIIGIAGGSGSGKTTLARSIIERFGDKVALISHDSYYKRLDHLSMEERTKVNYDHPESYETSLLIEDLEKLRDGIRNVFARKGEAVVEANIAAFDAGLEESKKTTE